MTSTNLNKTTMMTMMTVMMTTMMTMMVRMTMIKVRRRKSNIPKRIKRRNMMNVRRNT